AFLIGRDTMHQNQWLAVLEEWGGPSAVHPLPNSFPQELENQDVKYAFVSTNIERPDNPNAPRATGQSTDRTGEIPIEHLQAMGSEPVLSPPMPEGYAQKEQMTKAK